MPKFDLFFHDISEQSDNELKILSDLGRIVMTTAEKLMQQGMQKGKLEDAREMVLEVLEERFEGVT